MQTKADKSHFMPRKEVAALYGVDEKTVDRWGNLGRIASIVTPGGRRKYPRAEIEEQARQNGWSEFSSMTDD